MQYLQHNNCFNNKVWNNFFLKKHTHTSSNWQLTCQTLKTFMTHFLKTFMHLSSTTKKLQLSIIITNHSLPNLKKRNHFPIYFFHEKQIKEKLWSLSIICTSICYTNDIYSRKDNVLRDQIASVTQRLFMTLSFTDIILKSKPFKEL